MLLPKLSVFFSRACPLQAYLPTTWDLHHFPHWQVTEAVELSTETHSAGWLCHLFSWPHCWSLLGSVCDGGEPRPKVQGRDVECLPRSTSHDPYPNEKRKHLCLWKEKVQIQPGMSSCSASLNWRDSLSCTNTAHTLLHPKHLANTPNYSYIYPQLFLLVLLES